MSELMIVGLEVDLRRDLAGTRACARPASHTETSRSWIGIHDIWTSRRPPIPEIRAVEDIEELSPKFKINGFRNPGPFDKAHIIVIGIRITKFIQVGRCITKFERTWDRKEICSCR